LGVLQFQFAFRGRPAFLFLLHQQFAVVGSERVNDPRLLNPATPDPKPENETSDDINRN